MARTFSIPRATISREYTLEVERILQAVGKSQSDKFKEKAREIGCDEDEAAFERTLKRIVPRKPKPKEKAPKK